MGSPQALLPPTGPSWPTLPVFPHPASLFAGVGNPFVVGEASSATASLDKLKDDLRSGVYDLSLAPPTHDRPALAALPPTPIPPVTVSRKRSSIALSNGATHPIKRPPLLRSLRARVPLREALDQWTSRLASQAASLPVGPIDSNAPASGDGIAKEDQGKGKSKAVDHITATLNSRHDAILFELGAGPGSSGCSGAAWVTLQTIRPDGSREDHLDACTVHISEIKLFAPSECTRGPPLLHAVPGDAAYRDWGQHLTALQLTLPELLYRLPYVPSLLPAGCFYCGKRMISPDGLPAQGSGLLGVAQKRRKRKAGRHNLGVEEKVIGLGVKAEHGEEGRGSSEGGAAAQQEGVDGAEDAEEEAQGRWVCWHASCEP